MGMPVQESKYLPLVAKYLPLVAYAVGNSSSSNSELRLKELELLHSMRIRKEAVQQDIQLLIISHHVFVSNLPAFSLWAHQLTASTSNSKTSSDRAQESLTVPFLCLRST
jgi:hypothetical protein